TTTASSTSATGSPAWTTAGSWPSRTEKPRRPPEAADRLTDWLTGPPSLNDREPSNHVQQVRLADPGRRGRVLRGLLHRGPGAAGAPAGAAGDRAPVAPLVEGPRDRRRRADRGPEREHPDRDERPRRRLGDLRQEGRLREGGRPALPDRRPRP